MDYEVKKKISINKKCRVGEFWYDKKEDSIAYEAPFILPVQIKVTGLRLVEVTPTFLKMPTIMRGWIDLNILCLLLDSIRFVQEHKLMLHGSCYELNGKGILNIGFQNTGKTYNTLKAVTEGAYLISEEYTIINENGKACPYKEFTNSCCSWNTIKDCGIYLTPRELLLLGLRTVRAKVFPFMFEAVVYKTFPVSKIITTVDEVRIRNNPVKKDLYEKLVYMTENEYNFFSCDMLVAYAYITGFNLIHINKKRRFMIRMFANNVEEL